MWLRFLGFPLAVLAGLAVPGFQQSLRASAVRAATYELLVLLQRFDAAPAGRWNTFGVPGVASSAMPKDAPALAREAEAPSKFRMAMHGVLGARPLDMFVV